MVISLATAVVWSVSITLMDVAVTMPGVSSFDANYAIITTENRCDGGVPVGVSACSGQESWFSEDETEHGD